MVQHPEVLWAQRSSESDAEKNIIYLTVNLPDIDPSTLEYKLNPTSISFKAKTGNPANNIPEKEFGFDLDLYAEVIPEESKQKLSTRSLTAVIRKKEPKAEYWPRLTKEKVRNAFLKTDFSKWVDEDEQDGVANLPEEDDALGGMPGAFGGPGGPGGMDINQMMAQMGNMGGGGFDPSMLGAAGAGGAGGDEDEGDDSDDDGPPPLEDAEPSK